MKTVIVACDLQLSGDEFTDYYKHKYTAKEKYRGLISARRVTVAQAYAINPAHYDLLVRTTIPVGEKVYWYVLELEGEEDGTSQEKSKQAQDV